MEKSLKESIQKRLIGGFNICTYSNQITIEVFRTDFLNAPESIKHQNQELLLSKKYMCASDFFIQYKMVRNVTQNHTEH